MPKQHLPHLTGVRFLASLWIVCNHFVPKSPPSSLDHVVNRSNVAVSFFITMSGFITHWAYGHKRLAGGPYKQYLARRLGRVLFTTWIAMLLGVIVMAFTSPSSIGGAGHVARCFCFVETWLHPTVWCPNGQTWTIAALLPSWVLYPWSRRLIELAEMQGALGLIGFMLVAWLIEFGAIFYVFKAQGNNLTLDQHYETYTWPPSQFVDFFIGAAAAALARRLVAGEKELSVQWRRYCGLLGDIGFGVVALLCFAVPSDGYRIGYEPLYNHGLVPAFVCFLVGTSVAATSTSSTGDGGSGSSLVARALEHEILTSLGACSFEVFLFQWPIHAIVTGLLGNDGSAETFVCMCLVLWGSAAAYVAYVETPLVALLRSHTEEWSRLEAEVLHQELPSFERGLTVEDHAQMGYGSTAA